MKHCALVLFAAFALAACHEGPTQADSDRSSPLFEIKDAVHSGGNQHFFFLPPMVSNPVTSGTFDDSREPVVEICQLSLCGTSTVATFTTTTGPGSETVRVNTLDEYYIVNWSTTDGVLGETYRIQVSVSGTELGYADVTLVSGGSMKNAKRQDVIPLKHGRTLPIKFRIEEGAVERPPTASGQLFGIEGSTLVTVDRTTGTMTPVGPIGIDPPTGLSVDASGALFSISHDPRRPGPQLITIDPLTGAGTPVGNVQPDLAPVNAIAFHPSGSLFGISLRDLVSISPLTGAVTVIGSTGFGDPGVGGFIRDIAFDAAGMLFGVTRDFGDPTRGITGTPSRLITIDYLTGAATTVALLDDPAADLLGIAFDAGGLLFGVSCGDRPSLVTINRSTGALTTVGPLGPSPPDLCAHDLAFAEQ